MEVYIVVDEQHQNPYWLSPTASGGGAGVKNGAEHMDGCDVKQDYTK